MPGLYPTAYRPTFPAFFMRLRLGCFYCLCVFCLFVFSILSRRCPLLATFLSILFCLLSLLTSDSRFDLVWFRLSCDHGWIRSGSINVRKTTTTRYIFYLGTCASIRARFTVLYIHVCVTTAVCMYITMYICMVITCMVITYSKGKDQPGKDQPGKVTNLARGQLAEQGK